MGRLPITDKNATLSIFLSNSHIRASLAYSHYDVGRKYVLSDISKLDIERDALEDAGFWSSYFVELGRRFDWEILANTEHKYGYVKMIDFHDEGEGVANIRLIIPAHFKRRGECLAGIRQILPEVVLELHDSEGNKKKLVGVRDKLGYDEMILLDLDLDRFDAYLVSKNSKSVVRTLDKPAEKSDGEQSHHYKIAWDTKISQVECIRDSRLRAFLSKDISSTHLINMWANYIYARPMNVNSPIFQDILRAFSSVQLMSISNDGIEYFKQFGNNALKKSALILTGEVVNLLEKRGMLLALLDGLQLRGRFDLYFDRDNAYHAFGQNFSEGINATDFILSRSQIVKPAVRVYIPEIPGFEGEKKVVFEGSLIGNSTGHKVIYALTPEITEIAVPSGERVVAQYQFVKGAYVEGAPEDGEEHIFEGENEIQSILVDARFKPVVYGPDFRANSYKLNNWLREQTF